MVLTLISSIKRKFEFAITVVKEPKLILYRYKMHKLLSLKAKLTAIKSFETKNIEQHGLTKITLSEQNLRLVKKTATRFSRLLDTGRFHHLPDPERSNTVAFGSYLYYFNRGWSDWFPEITVIVEEGMGDTLRGYFGQDYRIKTAQIARKKYIDENCPIDDPYSNFWHFDWRRMDESWLLIVINLSEQKDGEAFHTLDLKASATALKEGYHGRYAPDGLPKALKNEKIYCAGGPIGTCYIANVADMLHRAGDPLPGKNCDVIFVFVGAETPWPNTIGFKNSSATKQIASDQSVA
jgi:hypothetical protein